MTDLTDLINTLKEAQEAIEFAQKAKEILFKETDYNLQTYKEEDERGTESSEVLRDFYRSAYTECRSILSALGVREEWIRTSEVYKKYKPD